MRHGSRKHPRRNRDTGQRQRRAARTSAQAKAQPDGALETPEMLAATEDTATEDAAAEAPAAPEGATAPNLNVLTGAIGLMMASPKHRHLFLADLEWALLPPLALKQFRLFTKDNRPVALATWAFVSETVAKRLEAGAAKLKPGEWKSGERCWIVDLVAPYGGATEFVSVLRDSVLKDCEVSFSALDPKTGERPARNPETSA